MKTCAVGAAAIGHACRLGRAFQHSFQLARDEVRRRAKFLQDLRDRAIGLLQQRQEDMLGIDLRVLVALQDLVGPHGRFLRLFGKSIKSHGCP